MLIQWFLVGKLSQNPVFVPFESSLIKPGAESAGPVSFA